MKRLSFYLVLSSLVTIPTVVLISFLSLALLTFGTLHKPESFAKDAAGWMPIAKGAYYGGGNDNETYSYWFERHLRIPVYNLGVSSYGTVREISRGIAHPQFEASR